MSLANLILQSDDLPRKPFPCPEWPEADKKLFVRGLTGDERLEWEQCFVDPSKRTIVIPSNDPQALVAGKALVDEWGGRVFSDEQIAMLGAKNTAVLNRAYDASLRLSSIRKSESEVAEDRKNSVATTGAGSC